MTEGKLDEGKRERLEDLERGYTIERFHAEEKMPFSKQMLSISISG